MPSGASRRYWLNYLDIADLTLDEQNFVLLKFGTIAPVGNLRVKESLPKRTAIADTLKFTVDDVRNRAADFLDYAQHQGAAAGGATGLAAKRPSFCYVATMNKISGLIAIKTNRKTVTFIIW